MLVTLSETGWDHDRPDYIDESHLATVLEAPSAEELKALLLPGGQPAQVPTQY
jgi:hypothetical protein